MVPGFGAGQFEGTEIWVHTTIGEFGRVRRMKQLPQSSLGLHTAVDTFQFCIQVSILSVFQQVGSMGEADGQALHLASWSATS